MLPISADQLFQLLGGLSISVALLGAVTALGISTGLLLAAGHLSRTATWRVCAAAFDIGLRGLPPVVLLFIVYYGVADIVSVESFWAATIALGLRAGGYFGRIFEGAVLAVPASQVLAARSIGMNGLGVFLYVVLPQALRLALPGIANEVSSQLKLTSLAFVVGVVELLRQARYLISGGHGSLLGILLIAAFLYYVANAVVFTGMGWIERRTAIPGFGQAGANGR